MVISFSAACPLEAEAIKKKVTRMSDPLLQIFLTKELGMFFLLSRFFRITPKAFDLKTGTQEGFWKVLSIDCQEILDY